MKYNDVMSQIENKYCYFNEIVVSANETIVLINEQELLTNEHYYAQLH